MDEEDKVSVLKLQLKQLEILWKQDVARRQAREMHLESEVLDLKERIANIESNGKKEIDFLSRRVRTSETFLEYLKSKAKIMAVPRYSFASCGIKRQEGVGLVDKKGIPMAEWSKQPSFHITSDHSIKHQEEDLVVSLEEKVVNMTAKSDGNYIEQTTAAVMHVTEVMEILLKRALLAEAEIDLEREKVKATEEVVRRKSLQIDSMWTRVEEMEKVAMGTSGILKEMQGKLEDMEQETTKQRQRANENEQELSKVRHDFEVLRSSVDSLVKARETILSMEKRIQEVEKISERLTGRVLRLEASQRDKEMEIKNLLAENDALRAGLDLKEAELAAISEQVRMTTLWPEASIYEAVHLHA